MQLVHREYGSGRPVVIIHGLLGSWDNWQTIARGLAPLGQRCVLPDLRNHGASPWTGAFTHQDLADDILGLADQLGLARFALVGHSLGGKAGMQLAFTQPSRLACLVVVDMAPKAYPEPARKVLEALGQLPLERITSRGDADSELARTIDDPASRGFLLKNLLFVDGRPKWRCNLPVLLESYSNLAGWHPAASGIYGGPTLFLRGGLSRFVGDDDIPRIQAAFPLSEIKTIADAGHSVQADKPGATLAAIAEFLEIHDG